MGYPTLQSCNIYIIFIMSYDNIIVLLRYIYLSFTQMAWVKVVFFLNYIL